MIEAHLSGAGSEGAPPAAKRNYSALYLAPLAILTAWLYGSVLAGLASEWWNNPDYGHGLVVPIFVAYLIWRDRKRLAGTPLAPSNLGLLVMAAALAMFLTGQIGLEQFLSRSSLVVLAAGMVLFLAGRPMLRALAFPLGYLLLAVPLPALVFNQITFPLQLAASRLAAFGLHLAAIPVLRQGTLLSVPGYNMEVAQACSGIRSLLSLLAVVIAFLYLGERRTGIRAAMVTITVPVAVIGNALRVFCAGWLGFLGGRSLADGFLHLFSGVVIFISATALLLWAHGMLSRAASRRGSVAA
ncbi:MAG: exosortase [Bryobacteraceae bacterium]